jgi:hypothetical protein
MQRGGGQTLRKPQVGAIVVEFAVAIPVVLAILYYLHDVPKAKRMQSQVNFCAHCMVNILQNTNHRVNHNDIRYAMAASYLTIYPGETMYSKVEGNQVSLHGNCPCSDLFYVKRINGQNKILWKRTFDSIDNTAPKVIAVEARSAPASIVGLKLNEISMKEGEVKMILHCYRYFYANGSRCLWDGRSLFDVTSRESFEFLVFNPEQSDRDSNDKKGGFFLNLVIFTPKPGLFDENPPAA